MATPPPRNAPCPCGSGKKYKQCCLGKPVITKRSMKLPIVLCVLAVCAGIIVGIAAGPSKGFGVGAGGLLLIGVALLIWKPPPSSGGGKDPAGLSFGR